MRASNAWIVGLVLLLTTAPAAAESDPWAGYLDFAYVYTSAEPSALRARLEQYGREAGMPLDQYRLRTFEVGGDQGGPLEEALVRRKAIAYFLDYLAEGNTDSLDQSVSAIRQLRGRLGRYENRYWYHYILAHRALEKGRRFDFVAETLDLWLEVVVPLEAPYEALHTLSLSDAPNSGFASALPYAYENVARMILLKSQEMGLDRSLDPLGAVVLALQDGRVGAHPDVIPPEASSRDYLERIVERLRGPESDAGSLTFTLSLFEAGKYHDRARGLLADRGFESETLEAIRLASGAYETALDRTSTVQGEAAVYTRVLRQLGEIYAAKQRLGVDPEVETPFSIEGAMGVYGRLHEGRLDDSWRQLGYAEHGRPAWLAAKRGLWEEIQEATLNLGDYYLSRSVEEEHRAGEHSRNAARLYSRYIAFFLTYTRGEGREGVPDSAYFAAHEAARGMGDAFLLYTPQPSSEEIDLAILRYRGAMMLFPFDRTVWSSLTAALERQGRESEYMTLVRPAAEAVTRSRSVDRWIGSGEPGARRIAVLRRAFADSLAVMYLGFADASGVVELESSLVELRRERDEVKQRLRGLRARRGSRGAVPAKADFEGTVNPVSAGQPDAAELARLQREIVEARTLLERLDKQIAARTRTLPLYKATLETEGLAAELRQRRDHPVHALLRRMYHEERGESEE